MKIQEKIKSVFNFKLCLEKGPEKGRTFHFNSSNLNLIPTEEENTFLINNPHSSDVIKIEYLKGIIDNNNLLLKISTNNNDSKILFNYYFDFFDKKLNFQFSNHDKKYLLLDENKNVFSSKEIFSLSLGSGFDPSEINERLVSLLKEMDLLSGLNYAKNSFSSILEDPFEKLNYIFENYKPINSWKDLEKTYKSPKSYF